MKILRKINQQKKALFKLKAAFEEEAISEETFKSWDKEKQEQWIADHPNSKFKDIKESVKPVKKDSPKNVQEETDETMTTEEAKEYWRDYHTTDPILVDYDSFEDWYRESKQNGYIKDDKPSQEDNNSLEEFDETMTTEEAKQYWKENHNSDPILVDYDSFEDWYKESKENGYIKDNKITSSLKGFWIFEKDGTAVKFAKSKKEAEEWIEKTLKPIYGQRAKNKDLQEKEFKIEEHNENNHKHKILLEHIKEMSSLKLKNYNSEANFEEDSVYTKGESKSGLTAAGYKRDKKQVDSTALNPNLKGADTMEYKGYKIAEWPTGTRAFSNIQIVLKDGSLVGHFKNIKEAKQYIDSGKIKRHEVKSEKIESAGPAEVSYQELVNDLDEKVRMVKNSLDKINSRFKYRMVTNVSYPLKEANKIEDDIWKELDKIDKQVNKLWNKIG